MKKKSLFVALLSCTLLLSACGGGGGDKQQSKTPSRENKQAASQDKGEEKVLRTIFSKQGDGTNFDTPWWNRGDLYKVITFRSLFKANNTLTEFNPDLVKEYKPSEDGLTYEFTLKDNLKWSDGKPLTGEDVKFSIEGALKGAKVNGIYTATFSKIEGGKELREKKADSLSGITVDGQKVTIKLAEPVGNLVPILSQFAILPKHGFEGVDMLDYNTAPFWKSPITNGMYKVEEIVTDSYITLVPNENYEGTAPKIAKVVVNIVPSEGILTAVADGQSDFFNSKVPAEIQKLSENSAWQKTAVDTLFYYYLVFNLKGNDTRPANKALQDPKVREAIYYAIDRETLAKNLYGEIGEVAALGVPARDTVNYNDKINSFKYDPEKAKALLKEAGYDENQTLEFRYYMADQTSVDLYNAIAADLAKVGIKVNVQKFAGDATGELFDIRNYDIALKGLSAFGYDEWYGEYAATHANFPKIIGHNEAYDKPYTALLQATTPEKKAEALKQLQTIEETDLTKMPIFVLKNMIFVNGEKVDTKGANFGNPWFAYDLGFENWELK